MKDKLKSLFNEQAAELISEETLDAIEAAFNQKVKLATEAALQTQDDEYAVKLEKLLKAIDKDATYKLRRVAEAIDINNTKKLKMIVKKYEKALNEDATKFKSALTKQISLYLETYLDEVIPQEQVAEACRNKTAMNVLEGLRKVLAVDSALMKESVRDALVNGNDTIKDLQEKLNTKDKETKLLAEKLETLEREVVLEKKTAGMPAAKKEYILKVLDGKSVEFINENFDYAVKLIDKKKAGETAVLREQALRKVKTDAPVPVSQKTEKGSGLINEYVSELENNF